MARCCGSTGTCACKVEGGRHITVTGTGTSQDPFRIAANTSLMVQDGPVFDMGLSGTGTPEDPWVLQVGYANTSRLTDLPDVNAPAPGDWNVLAYNPATDQWEAAPPSVTAAGGILTDDSINGDGSVDAPLGVNANTVRYISVTAAGLGLTDAAINSLVRPFADEAARDAASPTPVIGTISMLLSDPGRLDYWDGTDWFPITNGIQLDVQPGEVLALSGSYNMGTVTQYVRQLEVVTDVDGRFEVIPAVDLSGYAGVLSVHVQPMGTVGWVPVVDTGLDNITATAFRLDGGAPYAGYTLAATVTALLY